MKRKTIGLIAALTAASGLGSAAAAQALTLNLTLSFAHTSSANLAIGLTLDDEKKHDEKALKIIDAYVEKIGGKDFIMSIKSMHTKGAISIPMAGMTGTMEIFAAQPGKMTMIMDIPGFGKTESGYDGEYGWSSDPMQGPRLMSDEEIADMDDQMDPNSAAKHREMYQTIEHAGEVTFKGEKAHKIRLVREGGRESFEYYSAESGLMIGQESVQASPMGEIKVVTQLSDYKEFDGMTMPTKMTQNIGPQQIIITITEVNLNEVKDEIFKRPAAVEALVEAQAEG